MSLINGQTYNLGVSWGVFLENENSWDLAKADRAGQGNIRSQKWYISNDLKFSELSGIKLAAGASAMALATLTLF